MDVKELIKSIIVVDPFLNQVLIGGVHSAIEISRTFTPMAFSDTDILPCALIKISGNFPADNTNYPAIRTPFRFFLYEPYTSNLIVQVLDRLYSMFSNTQLANTVWESQFVSDVPDAVDNILQCRLAIANYQLIRTRSS